MNASPRSARFGRRRPLAAEDLLRIRVCSRPRFSPDGRRIVFAVRQPGAKNEYDSHLWLVDAAGGEPRQFTRGGRESAPAWSPDGSRLAFVSRREKFRPQLALIDAGGGEARPLTQFPEGSLGRFAWSPDGKRLAVAFREQHPDWTEAAKQEREKTGASTPPRATEDTWYRLDGDGYFLQQRYALYLVDAATGDHRLVYDKDTLGGFDFDFSPDGREVLLATNRDKQALRRPWKTELLRLDLTTGKQRSLPLPPGPKGAPRWAPDGRRIAYAAREGGEDGLYSTDNVELWLCDADGGGARSLSGAEDYCLLATTIGDTAEAEFDPAFRWSPRGDRLFAALGWHGTTQIASLPASGGEWTFHTRGAAEHELGSFAPDGERIALCVADPTHPPEAAVLERRGERWGLKRLSRLNGELLDELDLAAPETQWLTADDGNRVQVWTITPPPSARRATRGKRRPAVLEIHGGPHAQYGSGFFFEFQLLAAQGYLVCYANPRGSKGYGREHTAAIRGAWGSADWTDMQAVIAHLQERPDVDLNRMAVMGGSYGGYLTNWAIGHSDAFACAITDRCVSNLVSFGGNSDHPGEPDRYFPGNFWDRPEARWRQSPIAHLGTCRTPTLVIHSEGDLRCNIEQGEQVFTALQLLGVPSRMVRYPSSTSHGMSRNGPPDLRLHRLGEILGWLRRYLEG